MPDHPAYRHDAPKLQPRELRPSDLVPGSRVTDSADAARQGTVRDSFANGAIVRVEWDGETHADGTPYVSDIGFVRLRLL